MDLNNVSLERYYNTNPERIPIDKIVLLSALKCDFYDYDSTISTTYVPASGKTQLWTIRSPYFLNWLTLKLTQDKVFKYFKI